MCQCKRRQAHSVACMSLCRAQTNVFTHPASHPAPTSEFFSPELRGRHERCKWDRVTSDSFSVSQVRRLPGPLPKTRDCCVSSVGYTYGYEYMYIIYIYIYVCMFICTCTHKHTHTYRIYDPSFLRPPCVCLGMRCSPCDGWALFPNQSIS